MSLILIVIFVIHLSIHSSTAEFPQDERPDNRIINGFTPGRFDNPHVALLFIRFPNGRAACTGTLISPRWVVTAGHCSEGAVTIEVHLGVYNRNETSPQIIIVNANNIFVHPDFVTNDTVTINDIAVLRLNPRANILLRGIKPIAYICATTNTFANRIGRVCGWGITSDTATNITFLLQCLDVPVITNDECEQSWANQVRDTNICTRVVNNRTTCHGDSGGPLVVTHGIIPRPKLVGSTSFGSNPCAGTFPDVFTRISSFSSWIGTITGVFCSLL